MININHIALVVIIMASIGGFGLALFYPYLSGSDRADKRKKELKKSIGRTVKIRTGFNRREQVAQSLKEIEQKKNNRNKLSIDSLIDQAGLNCTKNKFYIYSSVSAFILFSSLYWISGNLIVSGVGLFVGGLGFPRWILSFLRKKRFKNFVNELPNAMDVIVRGIRSGLPIGDCLRIISTEAAEPVRGEFRRIVEAQSLGISVGEACLKLYERVPVPEANFFGIVISIQQKSGGNLSEVLGNLSKVIRDRRKMRQKIEAMSMEAKASASIIGSIPVVMGLILWFISPGHIKLLFETEPGNATLVVAAIIMSMGVFVMKKMINFDI